MATSTVVRNASGSMMMPSNNHTTATATAATTTALFNIPSYNPAVSRSQEFLSCAKTALKIAQQQQKQQQQSSSSSSSSDPSKRKPYELNLQNISPNDLQLNPGLPSSSSSSSCAILEEGLTLLRSMEYSVTQLQGLVRRRGHTNDPTQEISIVMQQMEQDMNEVTDFIQQLQQTKRPSKQSAKHWQWVATWFQQVAQQQSVQVKELLKLRGTVLADQAQRRKLVVVPTTNGTKGTLPAIMAHTNANTNTTNTTNIAANSHGGRRQALPLAPTITPYLESPLFTVTPTTNSKTGVHRMPTTMERPNHPPTNQSLSLGPPPPPPSAPTTMVTSNANGSNTTAPSNTTNGHSQGPSSWNGPSTTYPSMSTGNATTATTKTKTTSGYPYGTGYTGRYGGGSNSSSTFTTTTSTTASGTGYGGYGADAIMTGPPSFQMGMRQRKTTTATGPTTHPQSSLSLSSSSSQQQQQQQQQQQEEEAQKVQSQIQERIQQRKTAQRLNEARQAERTLGELGTLFGKMSTLISTQGEVLEKIEDDVEAAYTDVAAGQEELTKLYHLKKGNRPLIIKTFAILIFLICFMRLYKK